MFYIQIYIVVYICVSLGCHNLGIFYARELQLYAIYPDLNNQLCQSYPCIMPWGGARCLKDGGIVVLRTSLFIL